MGKLCCAFVIKERAKQDPFSETGYVKEYIKLNPAQFCRQHLPFLCTLSLRKFLSGQEISVPEILSYVWVSCLWAIKQFEDNPSWFLGCTSHANETWAYLEKILCVLQEFRKTGAHSKCIRTRKVTILCQSVQEEMPHTLPHSYQLLIPLFHFIEYNLGILALL